GIVTVIQPGLLLNGIWFLGIGWFLLAAAEASDQAFMVDRVLREIPVADVMQQNVPFVDSDLSVADWIDSHVLPLGQRCSLVRKDQRVIGLITMSDSRKISRDRWSDTRVREIMTPLERLHTVTPETDLAAIVRNMGFYSINQVPVVDQKGVVVGWIGREGILKTLHARSNTRS
ncbi:MAG: CBS domain-containing protein, partial [Pseudomonadota bacterium]|nr:CBS domain-containing protein [Pseudomonadota bacterium]